MAPTAHFTVLPLGLPHLPFHLRLDTLSPFVLRLLGATASPVVSMLLLSLVAAGVYSMFGPFWSMPSEFLSGYAAASGIALINSVGNLGGFAGPYGMGAIRDRTGSLFGGLAFVGVSMIVSAVLLWLLPRRARLHADRI